MNSVALVTCMELPEPDFDQDLLLTALEQAGIRPALLAWDDPDGKPGDFDLCVLRSCWNYYEDPDAFLAWIERADICSRLVNPPDVIRWNLHKSYLRELEDAGIPIIPTVWAAEGATIDLLETMRNNEWEAAVIKPAVSAASFSTKHFPIDRAREGQIFLDSMARERDMMIQRFISSVADTGERALVWIDGTLTHSVVKRPRFAGDVEVVSDSVEVDDRDRDIASRALSCVEGELLYARVDIVKDDDDKLLVSELELMEPSLFLLQCPEALDRFVEAIRRRCSRRL
jgi:hypothetical protein